MLGLYNLIRDYVLISIAYDAVIVLLLAIMLIVISRRMK